MLVILISMKPPRRFQRSQARNSAPPPGLERASEEIVGMRLNKYIAHSGVASRRVAGDMVKAGKVKVNGELHWTTRPTRSARATWWSTRVRW